MIKNFREVVRRLIREWVVGNVETCLPAVVIDIGGYQSTQQIKTLQPLPNVLFDDLQAVEMPYIYNVPVELTGTKESLISVPIKVGDTVMVRFSKRSISELKNQTSAEAYTPKNFRQFDSVDATALPAVLNSPANLNPSADHTEIKFKDILVSYQDDGTVSVTNGVVTNVYSPDGNISLNNDNATMTISPEGVLDYSSSPVSLTLTPSGNLLNVVAADTVFSGNVSVGGTMDVTGATSLSNTLAVTGSSTLSGATSVGNTLAVAGATTMAGASMTAATIGGADYTQHTHSNVTSGIDNTGPVT
jgi:hypothetical protein